MCKNGHDIIAVGINTIGRCRQCARDSVTKYRHDNMAIWNKRAKNGSWKRAGVINKDGSYFTNIDYDRHYQVQRGRCFGCDIHQTNLNRALMPDHNHKTGIFRALLCNKCNMGIGLLEDSPIIVRKLASLLEIKNTSSDLHIKATTKHD